MSISTADVRSVSQLACARSIASSLHQRTMFSWTLRLLLVIALCVPILGMAAPRPALVAKPQVKSPRVYVLDCGELIYNNPEYYGLKREEVADTNMPVTCYLVVHPKGTLLFDTGLSDKLIGRPVYENVIPGGYGQIVTKTLLGQLADIGYTPDDIDYLAISHSHLDHISNIGYFTHPTWLTPKAEYESMFGSTPRSDAYLYESLLQNKRKVFETDYDVFGDGSVVLLQTPGHTPGHQSVYVALRNTGGVVLSGDLYHYAEERTMDRMPARERSSGTPEARKAMESFLQKKSAQLWIGHSTAFMQQAIKAPGWYD